jgi:hypothetical protein
VLGREAGVNYSSKQECDENIKATRTSPYGFFGPVAYLSIRGSKYGLVIVDDFLASLGYSFCRINQKPKVH